MWPTEANSLWKYRRVGEQMDTSQSLSTAQEANTASEVCEVEFLNIIKGFSEKKVLPEKRGKLYDATVHSMAVTLTGL